MKLIALTEAAEEVSVAEEAGPRVVEDEVAEEDRPVDEEEEAGPEAVQRS